MSLMMLRVVRIAELLILVLMLGLLALAMPLEAMSARARDYRLARPRPLQRL